MRIGLIDVDGHNWPNLCLMKLSAWHKAQGHVVEWFTDGFTMYNKIYMSKVFTDEYSPDIDTPYNSTDIYKGGTGYLTGDIALQFEYETAMGCGAGLEVYDGVSWYQKELAPEIEHQYPDYSLYPQLTKDTAFGFLTRGCPCGCGFCIVTKKEGPLSHKVADLQEFWQGQKVIKLLDPNILAAREYPELLKQLAESGAWVDFTQGLDARRLTTGNIALLKQIKTKMVHFAWDSDQHSDLIVKNLRLYKSITGVDRRKAAVYVLTNYNTSHEFDLHRIYTLREIGLDPYVMIYNKQSAPKQTRMLQRWVNNKVIWTACARFEDYNANTG